MSKQDMRDEAERLVKEAMERKSVTIKQGDTRIEAICGKCGAPNRVIGAAGTNPGRLQVQGMRRRAADAVARGDDGETFGAG